jgi:hypothetical protein
MKVLVKRSCAAAGGHLAEGGIYDVDTQVGQQLIRMGRAVEAPAEVKPAPRKAKANGAD